MLRLRKKNFFLLISVDGAKGWWIFVCCGKKNFFFRLLLRSCYTASMCMTYKKNYDFFYVVREPLSYELTTTNLDAQLTLYKNSQNIEERKKNSPSDAKTLTHTLIDLYNVTLIG